jgi:katanin p60 ATPase-containing subunit A1
VRDFLNRDIIIQNPKVKFKDIVGLDDAKRILREAVQLPLIFPHLFTGLVEPWKGALLFGPPGTGKVIKVNRKDTAGKGCCK